MDSEAYYRIMDASGCDHAVVDRYLVINCVGVSVLTRPFTTYRPSGRRDYYLMLLDQGSLDMVLGGQVTTIQPGHVALFHPGEETWYIKRDDSELVYYWVHFTGYGADEILAGCGLAKSGLYYTGLRQEFSESFREIFQNYIERDSCHELDAAAQLAGILVQIRRSLDELASTRRTLMAGKLKESLNFIHRHYSQTISVRDLANLEHLSSSRYCALFRQHMGISPQNFIIELRLRMAADLMMKTDLSLKQISRMVGYDDQLYFSRLFRSKRGLSPRQYIRGLTTCMTPVPPPDIAPVSPLMEPGSPGQKISSS